MDTEASTPYEHLQRQVRELEARDAAHEAEKDGWLREKQGLVHIATSALRALGSQTEPLHPEGFWTRDTLLRFLDSLVAVSIGASAEGRGTWFWHKFRSLYNPLALPIFPTEVPPDEFDPRLYEVVPFRRSFPLELFEAIIESADVQAISRTAMDSLDCYKLFMPLPLRHIDLRWPHRYSTVRPLFETPDESAPMSPRLDVSSRGFQNIRTLRVSVADLDETLYVGDSLAWSFDCSRLPSGTLTLDLDLFELRLVDDRKDGHNDRYSYVFPSLAATLFAHLNPSQLVVSVDALQDIQEGIFFQVAPGLCRAMAQWDRLRTVHVERGKFYHLDEGIDFALEALEDGPSGPFFLSIEGSRLSHLEPIAVVWDLSRYEGLPMFSEATVLECVLDDRAETLKQPWLGSFTVVVDSEESGAELRRLMDESEKEVPSCLRWEVKK